MHFLIKEIEDRNLKCVGACRHYSDIECDLISLNKFDTFIQIQPPNLDQRTAVFSKFLKDNTDSCQEKQLESYSDSLGSDSEYFNLSELSSILDGVSQEMIIETQDLYTLLK